MHLGLCARRGLLSNWKQDSNLIPVQCAPLRHRKGEGTLYPAHWWARVKMSNVTKPLSILAITTAKEANIIAYWLFQDSLFLPETPMLQKKLSTVVSAQWTRAGFAIRYLVMTFKKSLERTTGLQICPVFTPKSLHLFLSSTSTLLSIATIGCSYFSSHSSGSENLTLAPVRCICYHGNMILLLSQ